jgi:hypothetical protein
MAELEKVIYSIERCICHVPDACQDCGYDNEPYPKCSEHLLRDAHDLLKAQEPKPPRFVVAYDKIFYACDNCGKSLVVIANSKGLVLQQFLPKYCNECGQAVKWPEPPKEG